MTQDSLESHDSATKLSDGQHAAPHSETPNSCWHGAHRWWGFLLIWGMLLAVSFYRAPIPGVNEPHYLTKAKHFWNSEFCPGDFFLDSSNPHLVFYILIGWLTTFCSLSTTAVIGRLVGLGLLAWGWNRAIEGPVSSLPGRLLATLLFLWFAAMGNLSGEWVIGGIESKIFAYGLILWGAAKWREGQTYRAAALAGVAVSLHPLAAGWWLIAVVAGWVMRLCTLCIRRLAIKLVSTRGHDPGQGVQKTWAPRSVQEWGTILGIGLLSALPGILPALAVLGGDPEVGLEASRLQLKWRLGHHTDPRLFPLEMYRYYGILLACWVAICCGSFIWIRRNSASRMSDSSQVWGDRMPIRGLFWFTVGSLLIAAAGAAIGWADLVLPPEWAERLRLTFLKFYFFRLADIVLPASLAIVTAWFVERALRYHPKLVDPSGFEQWRLKNESRTPETSVLLGNRWQWGPMLMLLLMAGAAVIRGTEQEMVDALMRKTADELTPAEFVNQRTIKREQWLQVCEWLRTSTPANALVASANMDTEWGVKWFAERSEYVSFKDCPQEPSGIVEWWQRRQALVKWSQSAKSDGEISLDDLHDLHEQTGIDYLLVTKYGPLPGPPAYTLGPFRVYAVPPR